ncbi:MAG: DUF192 domain-containing protein [Proteobacteria bacterium]|nr:DUF192 domain-containing protein [Pseudomonadota bacterium]
MRLRDLMALTVTLGLATASGTGAALAQSEPTGPQPTLPREPLTIIDDNGHPHLFHVELATTPQEQETGLMFRTSVPADGGMLFVFPTVQPEPFWMKNTLVPLDMVFINPDGTIRAIAENTVPESLAAVDSGGPVLAVLELQGGLTAKENISVGDRVVAPQFNDTKQP